MLTFQAPTPTPEATVFEKYNISDDAIDLLEDMLNTDPAIRPSALQCLSYPWLGGEASQIEDEPPSGLLTIEEEDTEAGAAHDLSQLSIHGKWNKAQGVSVDSGDSDILDPRQSKRFKSGQVGSQMPAPSQQLTRPLRPTHDGEDTSLREIVVNSQPPRLFGEVQASLVRSSGVFGTQLQQPVFAPEHSNVDASKAQDAQDELFTSAASHQPDDEQRNARTRAPSESDMHASNFASLVGAESDMRDLNMDSSQSAFSATADESEPTTPTTPNDPPQASVGQTRGSLEETPRPVQPTERKLSFNRQISLPLSASSFYDPTDPSTHSLEYASSVSGHDFTSHNLLPGTSFHSLPPTTANSGIDFEFDQPLHTVAQTQPEFIRPAPRLGRLTTTMDSFCAVALDLGSRITTWGRSPLNTIVFPDPLDTRVPKRGIMVYFHAKGIDKVEGMGGDWTKLLGLHCLIATDSSNGIFINGVKLNAKDAKGKQLYGRVYTGDEITVCQGHTKANLLKFTCVFNHGEAKEQRPTNGPGFAIEKMGQE